MDFQIKTINTESSILNCNIKRSTPISQSSAADIISAVSYSIIITILCPIKIKSLHSVMRTRFTVVAMATHQNMNDRSAPMSSRFSWFLTIRGGRRKEIEAPSCDPKTPRDVAVDSSSEPNHLAATRPGSGSITT